MLLINEIYATICGESRHTGRPCTLIRLTGCHVRCSWCDSAHSFSGGRRLSVDDVRRIVNEHGLSTVLVTGGEPLLQRAVGELLAGLMDDGRRVLLETSGTVLPSTALGLSEVPVGVHRIVDIKAPGSGIPAEQIDWDGIAALGAGDELKIVCAHREDFEWSAALVASDRLPDAATVSLSAVQGSLEARELAEWIVNERLDVCFQIQLHRAVWPDLERGV